MLDFINQSGPVKFFVAFAIVLALIGLTAWLVRRFGSNRLAGSTRGRQPRLAVIDAASVDGRRRLVLIRRDNVEHLMMIGGPNDLVVEPNIVRATAGRDVYRPAPDARPDARQDPRIAPVAETNGGNWPLQPAAEPAPVAPVPPPAPSRSYRAPVTDEPWVPPEVPVREAVREPAPRARAQNNQDNIATAAPSGSIASMASEFNARLSPDLDVPPPPPPRPAPMSAPMREPAAVVPPPPPVAVPAASTAPQTDRNLAEMAQRLEAALRRPSAKDDMSDPLAAPPKPADAPSSSSWRTEPKLDFAPEVKAEPKFDLTPEPKADMKPAQNAASKNPFDSLEEEMASLLGRQPGKT